MARLVLDPACITLTHSVPFQIDPPERQLGDGEVTDTVCILWLRYFMSITGIHTLRVRYRAQCSETMYTGLKARAAQRTEKQVGR